MSNTLTAQKDKTFIIGAHRKSESRWLNAAGVFVLNRSEAHPSSEPAAIFAAADIQATFDHHEGAGEVTVEAELLTSPDAGEIIAEALNKYRADGGEDWFNEVLHDARISELIDWPATDADIDYYSTTACHIKGGGKVVWSDYSKEWQLAS